MGESDASPSAEHDTQKFAIRFGIRDLFAALVLTGLHMTAMKQVAHRFAEGDEHGRMVAGAVLGAAFAAGSAYLAFRYCTAAGVSRFLTRVFVLMGIDFVFLSIPLMFFASDAGHLGVVGALLIFDLFIFTVLEALSARKRE